MTGADSLFCSGCEALLRSPTSPTGSNCQTTQKIVFYPEMVAFGGAERILLALSKHLNRHQIAHRFSLYYLSIDLQSHAQWELPIDELRPSRNPLIKVRALKRYLSSHRATGSGAALLVGIQAALHAGALLREDYVLMILDTPSLLSKPQFSESPLRRLIGSARNWATHLILRRGIRRAKTVIVTSQYMASEIKQLYGVDALVARQGGLSPISESRRTGFDGSDRLRVLSVSRLESNKRIDWILHALARFQPSEGPQKPKMPWHLDIVGEGSERSRLHSEAQRLGIDNRVTFHGFVSDARLEELYSSAALFVMPAFQGYGLPALEALSRHIPVVMHRDSGVSEILHGTPWVELIDGDPLSLFLGLGKMLARIESGQLASEPLPAFPSESDWAKEICQICGWR